MLGFSPGISRRSADRIFGKNLNRPFLGMQHFPEPTRRKNMERQEHVRVAVALLFAVGLSLFFAPFVQGQENAGKTPAVSSDQGREALKMLSEYLSEAALHNPDLESAFHRWKAALEKIPQVKALPDPRFTFAYYIRNVETRVGPQEARVALFQTFPWFGVLDLREDVAAHEANAAKAQYDALKLKIFYDVKNAFYEYAYLAQSLQITREDIELLRYFESVARARYSAGATPFADVVKTQVQLSRLEDRLKTLQDLRRPLMAKLAASTNLPPNTEFPWPPEVPVMILCVTDEELFRDLPEYSPQLKRFEYLEAREKAGIQLAEKDFYPDVTFGVEDIITGSAMNPATLDSGKDAVIASVTVNLPFWWEKRKAAVREGRAKLASATKGAEALKRSLLSDMELALYKYRDAQRKIDLYRNTLIPKAEESLGVTLEAFQAGTRSSLDLIDAEKTLLEFELSYIRALADQAQRLAELEWLLGKEIPCEIHGAVVPRHGEGLRP
jgi:cobalt-zinc-cadmium efflux system outer membrane protein